MASDGRKLERTRWPGIYKRGERFSFFARDNRGKQVEQFAPTSRNQLMRLATRHGTFLVALAAFLTIALPAAAGTPMPPSEALEALQRVNTERTSNGLPAVSLSSEWSSGCHAHNHYLQLNGWGPGLTAHDEDPSKPGYSAAGANAGVHAQLSMGNSWTKWNVFERFPFHLAEILRPQLNQIGFDETAPYTCLATIPVATSGANTISVYPGDGSKGIYYAEKLGDETPDPVEVLGLASNVTGPYLMAFAEGSWVQWHTDGSGVPYIDHYSDPRKSWIVIKQASLTDSAGTALRIKTGDASNSDGVLRGAAFIIPIDPLRPNSTYHASITLVSKDGSASVSKSWTFKTGKDRLGFGYSVSTSDGGNTAKTIITGHLTKTKFQVSAAKSVKLIYKFSKASSRFAYKLSRAKGTAWQQVRYVQRKGSFKGLHQITVKKLFGGKARIRGRYRLTLYADSGKRPVLKFRIV